MPSDDSSNLNFTTQGREWGDRCWKYEDTLGKVKKLHHKASMEWDILKEDSKGDESTAKSMNSKAQYIRTLENQIENTEQLHGAMLIGYEKFFDKPYVPYVKTSANLSSQEIDSKWSPKQY